METGELGEAAQLQPDQRLVKKRRELALQLLGQEPGLQQLEEPAWQLLVQQLGLQRGSPAQQLLARQLRLQLGLQLG